MELVGTMSVEGPVGSATMLDAGTYWIPLGSAVPGRLLSGIPVEKPGG